MSAFPRPRLAHLLPPLVMGALVLGLFSNALVGFDPETGGLRAYRHFMLDDRIAIERHPHVYHPGGLSRLWFTDYWVGRTDDKNLYRPITVLSYHLNARSIGWRRGDALSFRLTNIVLIWLVGCVTAWWFAGHLGHPGAAWLASLLLVAHPTNAELVNQIVGRADTLAVLGVVGFGLAQRRAQLAGRWSSGSALAALALALIALGAKETGLLLIPLVLVQGWLSIRRPPAGLAREQLGVNARALALVGVPLVLYAVGRLNAVGLWPHYPPAVANDLTGNPLRGLALAERLPGAFSTAWFDLRQIFWPDLGVNHNPIELPTWTSGSAVLGVLVLLAGLTGIAWALRRRHWLSIPLILAGVHYLMVGNLLAPSGVYAANRLMLVFTLAAAAVLAEGLRRHAANGRRRRAVGPVACAAALLAMAPAVWVTNQRWRSHRSLMAAELERRPEHPAAMYLFGAALAEGGDWYQASAWLERVVELRPDSVEARRNLDNTYFTMGRTDDALTQYQRIADLAPDFLEANLQITALALERGELERAAYHLERAERVDPHHPLVMYQRAVLALRRGNRAESLERYEALVRRYPDHLLGRRDLEKLRASLAEERAPDH